MTRRDTRHLELAVLWERPGCSDTEYMPPTACPGPSSQGVEAGASTSTPHTYLPWQELPTSKQGTMVRLPFLCLWKHGVSHEMVVLGQPTQT